VQADSLEGVLEENDQLRAKIEGLNEEYNKIGLEVFKACKLTSPAVYFAIKYTLLAI
jgi:hypothetical protein